MDRIISDLIDPALSVLMCLAGWPAAGCLAAVVLAVGPLIFPNRALAEDSVIGLVAVSRTYSSIRVQHLLDIMKKMGLEAESDNSFGFEAIVWKFWGFKSTILFHENGKSITFCFVIVSDKVDAEDHRRWNRDFLYSRSFQNDDGNPALAMDLDLAGGVCEGRIVDFIETCRVVLRRWLKEVVNKD
jgi:hypothetical protein